MVRGGGMVKWAGMEILSLLLPLPCQDGKRTKQLRAGKLGFLIGKEVAMREIVLV